MNPPAALALLGPTAAGKTAAALAAARRWPLEIISVDSALVYRGMDIGTAKPSVEERAAVPHHLIDVIDPAQSWSAAQFMAATRQCIDEIRARGRIPLLAGGTMLYIHALMRGLHDLPSADPEIRAQLDAEAAAYGWPALHARLAEIDPPTAARLAPNDAQRIQRALELHALTGRPMSVLIAEDSARADRLPLHLVSLEPSDRAALHARIARRFRDMLDAGFLEEVRALRARPDLHTGLPSIRCVGYRQAWDYLDGKCTREELFERGIAATRQLAKRQLTWLRGMPHRRIIDCLAPDASEQVCDALAAHLPD